MRTIDDYLALVPPLNAKPKFMAEVEAVLEPFADAQAFLQALPGYFDLDSAIGVQLDAVGEWVGISRNVPVPIAEPWFRWDDPLFCLDFAPWQPIGQGNLLALTALDDETYRRLIRAKIEANVWDGTNTDAQTIVDAFFLYPGGPNSNVFIQNNTFADNSANLFSFDDPRRGWDTGVIYYVGLDFTALSAVSMSVTIGVAGEWPNIVDIEVLNQGMLPLVSSGVAWSVLMSSINGTPLFGFDVENDYVAGFDVGSIGINPDEIAIYIADLAMFDSSFTSDFS